MQTAERMARNIADNGAEAIRIMRKLGEMALDEKFADLVEKGVEAVRQIPSLQQMGVDFENDMSTLMPPAQFWSKFDAGEFK